MPQSQSTSALYKWGGLVVLSLALAIIIIDTTLLNVAIATIIGDLKTSLQEIQWVISAYSLVLAAFTITGGRLGDLFGRKRMFVLGAILFAIGSFTASVSQNFTTLLIGESIIEGFGAALMMPATSSLLVANFRGKERALAFGVWGAIAGASSAIGPILGGYLTSHYSWRWGFRINVFVVLLLLAGSVIIKDSRERGKQTLDVMGIILSSIGMLGVVFGIIESSTYGWWNAKETFTVYGHQASFPWGLSVVPFSILLGAVFMGAFLWWQKRREAASQTPLVSLHLFQNEQYISAVIVTAILSMGMSGIVFAIPVFLETVRGLDAFHTGLSLLPLSILLLIVAPMGARLVTKVSPKRLIQAGLGITTLAAIVLYYAIGIDATAATFIPGLALFGLGMGLVMAQINNVALSAVSVEEAGEASGVNNTIRQLGSTLGSAIVGTVLVTAITNGIASGISNSTVIPDTAKPAIARTLAAQGGSAEFAGPGAADAGQVKDPLVGAEITRVIHQATTDGNRTAMAYTTAFEFLGFLAAFLLPNKMRMGHDGPGHQHREDGPVPVGH